MNALKFIDFVDQIKPQESQLLKLGFDNDIIYQITELYHFRQINRFKDYENEIVNLLKNFVPKPIEVYGGITLRRDLPEDEKFYYFGLKKVDYLMINKESNEVQLLENSGKVLTVANSDISFLNILKHLYLSFTQRITENSFNPCKLAEELTAISKIPTSKKFYKMICGCRNI